MGLSGYAVGQNLLRLKLELRSVPKLIGHFAHWPGCMPDIRCGGNSQCIFYGKYSMC